MQVEHIQWPQISTLNRTNKLIHYPTCTLYNHRSIPPTSQLPLQPRNNNIPPPLPGVIKQPTTQDPTPDVNPTHQTPETAQWSPHNSQWGPSSASSSCSCSLPPRWNSTSSLPPATARMNAVFGTSFLRISLLLLLLLLVVLRGMGRRLIFMYVWFWFPSGVGLGLVGLDYWIGLHDG